jgi:hypothetical protein
VVVGMAFSGSEFQSLATCRYKKHQQLLLINLESIKVKRRALIFGDSGKYTGKAMTPSPNLSNYDLYNDTRVLNL